MRWLVVMALASACGCASYELIEDIAYDDRYGERTRLDLYLPDPPIADAPLVIMIHGGAWRLGSKELLTDAAARVAHTGYAVAAINYRLAPDNPYPLPFQDVFCALGFLESRADEYSIDLDRIAVMGYSAGGHLSLMMALAEPTGDFEPDCPTVPTVRPAAVLSQAGPSDLRLYGDADSIEDLIGGSQTEFPGRYDRASPVTHASPDDPPTLLIYGSDDLLVPYEQAEAIDTALSAVGVDVRVMKIRGAGHLVNPGGDLYEAGVPITSSQGPEAWAAQMDFLDDRLRAQ
ncbi:MAG: alpha/beta hydrolase [Deltaproteobacteria bacterium]|nr:alpha/beta hydrolase [Deltaproteobacteria bacterium]